MVFQVITVRTLRLILKHQAPVKSNTTQLWDKSMSKVMEPNTVKHPYTDICEINYVYLSLKAR